ncbi:hypothetical protein ABIE50_005565 [Chitinophaga sp. OAE865]
MITGQGDRAYCVRSNRDLKEALPVSYLKRDMESTYYIRLNG